MHISGKEQETYLRACHRFVFPPDKGENNMNYAATVAANLASVGFGMTKDDITQLSKCSTEDIVRFYQDIYPVIAEQEAYSYRPFYPNFPQEVMEKDKIDIFVDQLLYALTGFELTPDKMEETKAAFPFMGKVSLHPVQGASQEEYKNDIRSLMKSSVSYIPCHIAMLQVFAKEHPNDAISLVPPVTEMKQRENRIILGCILEEQTGSKSAIRKYCQDPTDVLRYAAVQSGMNACRNNNPDSRGGIAHELPEIGLHSDDLYVSVYQKAALQYDRQNMPSFRLSRSDRRFCMNQLEKMSDGKAEKLATEMIQHKSEWKRMFNNMHYPEIKAGAPVLADASRMIRSNTPIDRYSSRVEKAVHSKDLDAILKETASRPGDFIRRFDKILRIGLEQGEPEKVLNQLKQCARESGIAPVISLASHIQSRTQKEESRSFTIEKSGTVWNTAEKNREPIPQIVCDRVHSACLEGISEKFHGKGEMGRVYISPEMVNYKVPAATRTLNEGVDVNTIGSVTDIDPAKDTLRLFVGWGNEQTDSYWNGAEIDIDLTADIVTSDGSIAHCGWNGDYVCELNGDAAVVYSGDVRTGAPGKKAKDCGCEYIDLNPAVLKEHMAQYVICGISLYDGASSFRDMKHLDFGYMERDSKDRGELFDTRTVQTKQAVRNNSSVYVPMIYDVQNERMISVNMSISKESNVLWDEMRNILSMLPVVQARADQMMTLNDLITANVLSNGTFVQDPSQADIVYMSKRELADYCKDNDAPALKDGAQVHCQDDFAHITGVLMADPVPGTDLFHPAQPEREECVRAIDDQLRQEPEKQPVQEADDFER